MEHELLAGSELGDVGSNCECGILDLLCKILDTAADAVCGKVIYNYKPPTSIDARFYYAENEV